TRPETHWRPRASAAASLPRPPPAIRIERPSPILPPLDSLLAGLRRLDRAARLLPRAEAAGHVRDGFEAHALHGLGRERRAQAAGAEEHKALVLGKDRFVVGALAVDPHPHH